MSGLSVFQPLSESCTKRIETITSKELEEFEMLRGNIVGMKT